ncbi:hypothetical protein NPIL_72251 [Nephila pilipes]|uniref:Uncharacterized protein n=1 Tax=Nephila pilipes TaxID=299642 RepID=A0A8X6TJN5_NEPPI|nr:hypothetical protein NPIL_72251 [Nephila pilipes]
MRKVDASSTTDSKIGLGREEEKQELPSPFEMVGDRNPLRDGPPLARIPKTRRSGKVAAAIRPNAQPIVKCPLLVEQPFQLRKELK